MAPFQLFSLESNDDSEGSVLHSLGGILVDLRGLVVPCRVFQCQELSVHGWDACILPCLSFPASKAGWGDRFPAQQGSAVIRKGCVSLQWDRSCFGTEQSVGPILTIQPGMMVWRAWGALGVELG